MLAAYKLFSAGCAARAVSENRGKDEKKRKQKHRHLRR